MQAVQAEGARKLQEGGRNFLQEEEEEEEEGRTPQVVGGSGDGGKD